MIDSPAGIPEEAAKNAAAVVSALEQSFRPLLSKLRPEIEPAIVLSESAVTAE